MALAHIVSSDLKPLAIAAPPMAAAPVAAPANVAGHIANFHVPQQEQTNWCWAAVSVGVAALHGTAWQQCTVVTQELNQVCCPSGSNLMACNVPYYLDRALARVGHFANMAAGTASFLGQIATEISAGRPLGVRIGWSGGGGHFIAIAGYSANGGQFVDVEDPWYLASTVSYAVLQSSYKGTGTWTHTYWTN